MFGHRFGIEYNASTGYNKDKKKRERCRDSEAHHFEWNTFHDR